MRPCASGIRLEIMNGTPPSEVVRKFGVTRGVVAGLANRMREKAADRPRAPQPQRAPRRAEDERLLAYLHRAAVSGVAPTNYQTRNACAAVVEDDLLESTHFEDRRDVLMSYPWFRRTE